MSIGTDRTLSADLVTWLILVEAIILPFFLWLGSRRYKHAISYVVKVHILRRNHDNEESESHSVTGYSYLHVIYFSYTP